MFQNLRIIIVAIAVLFFIEMSNAQSPIAQAEAPSSILAVTVEDIPKGSKATIGPEGLVIGEDRKVWVNKHQLVGGESGVMVLHNEDGSFAVEISDDKLRWLKTPVTNEIKKGLLPIAKVSLIKSKDVGQQNPADLKKN